MTILVRMMCTQVMIYTHSNIETGGPANLT
jgi:hypothetical protein